MSVIAIMRGISDEASLFTEDDVVSITLPWSTTVVALSLASGYRYRSRDHS